MALESESRSPEKDGCTIDGELITKVPSPLVLSRASLYSEAIFVLYKFNISVIFWLKALSGSCVSAGEGVVVGV